MAIALAASYFVATGSNALPQTITTSSFTPATGEIILVKAVTENETALLSAPSATGGGITWTKRLENVAANTTYISIWTGTVTAGGSSITISMTSSGGAGGGAWYSMVIERWTGAQLAASPVISSAFITAAPYTLTLTTTAANSVISYVDGDWKAIAPGTPTYSDPTSIVEGTHDKSTVNYVAYYAYQNAATAGSQTFGVTSPSGRRSTIVGIEIQSASVAPTSPTYGLMMMGVGV